MFLIGYIAAYFQYSENNNFSMGIVLIKIDSILKNSCPRGELQNSADYKFISGAGKKKKSNIIICVNFS